MRIAVEGCCHGELDKIYETLQHLERENKIKVDLLLICGDFQAVRNRDDLKAMAVPQKYQKLNTFHKYYSGEKVAPVLTIFIGGNHEASNYMQELPYGGWVAKNIYYMGYASVIQVGGLRIGGLSGIYKGHDYYKGHYECPPYTEDTKRSVYHIRNIEVLRLKQLSRPLDVFLSHDWPADIARYGNMEQLFHLKPFLKSEVLNGSLGSPPAAQLLHKLQPSYWFSAHLHVKYTAHVQHPGGQSTRFLSLDKCLPRRQFLQVLDFPDKGSEGPVSISLDPEWLCVLQKTNHLLHLDRAPRFELGPGDSEGTSFPVLDKDLAHVREVFGGDLTVPDNFRPTVPTLEQRDRHKVAASPPVVVNPQTTRLCSMLNLKDPNAIHLGISHHHNPPHSRHVWLCDGNNNVSRSSLSGISPTSQEMSTPLSSPGHPKPSPSLPTTAAVTSPIVQVDDNDNQSQAAQRRKSLQLPAPSSPSNEHQNGPSSWGEQKTSLPSPLRTDYSGDGLAAQRKRAAFSSGNSPKFEDSAGIFGGKSNADSSNQDRSGYLRDISQTSTTDCVERSLNSDSSRWGWPVNRIWKRPCPTNISGESPPMKKLKRRNESLYFSSPPIPNHLPAAGRLDHTGGRNTGIRWTIARPLEQTRYW